MGAGFKMERSVERFGFVLDAAQSTPDVGKFDDIGSLVLLGSPGNRPSCPRSFGDLPVPVQKLVKPRRGMATGKLAQYVTQICSWIDVIEVQRRKQRVVTSHSC